MNAFGVVSGAAAAVVLVKVSATPPTVSVVSVMVSGAAALVCRTQMLWPGFTLPGAAVKTPVQLAEYSPPTTDTGAAPLMPVIATAPEAITADGATSAWSAKENASGVVSAGTVVLVNVPMMPPTLSVVTVLVPGLAELVCRTQTMEPSGILLAAAVKVAVQPIEYCPPATVTREGAAIPVIVTAFEVSSVPSATLVTLVKENGSGSVSTGVAVPVICRGPTVKVPQVTRVPSQRSLLVQRSPSPLPERYSPVLVVRTPPGPTDRRARTPERVATMPVPVASQTSISAMGPAGKAPSVSTPKPRWEPSAL